MPAQALKSIAKRADVPLADAERYWDHAKRQAKKHGFTEGSNAFYKYCMGIVKRRMELAETNIILPESVIEAFDKLAKSQRKEPEMIMVKTQHIMGGGILNPLIEHIGDLTNRLTHHVKYYQNKPVDEQAFDLNSVQNKVEKMLRILNQGYGVDREIQDNIRVNASYLDLTPDELEKKLTKSLDAYARAHDYLPTYNKMQYMAKQAAVATGLRKWDSVKTFLIFLDKQMQSPENYVTRCAEYSLRHNRPALYRR